MTLSINKRTLVRIMSFATAIILVAVVYAYTGMRESQQSRRALEYQYMKSMNDLITHTQNIDTDLSKVMYVNSPALLSQMASKIWREAGFAKDIVSSLPIEYNRLQNTTKLLSQVGDYCVSLARTIESGAPITDEQRETLKSLGDYCDQMTREVITIGDGIRTGALTFDRVKEAASSQQDAVGAANITEGFTEFEEGFTAYPTLIYDGPFSDHIMQKEPERLKGETAVDVQTARKKASMAAGVAEQALQNGEDEKSKMECYGFNGDNVSVSVTKQGGLVAYMLKSRAPSTEAKLSPEQAIEYAKNYLAKLGVTSMESTYYEISNNIMTINFAFMQDDTMIYPDLIKVGIALDNGEVLSFDARGFIVNHRTRELAFGAEDQARAAVSNLLTIESMKKCVIPTGGLGELSAYEYKCKAADGNDILVYINATNYREEQLLMLLVSDNGTLTL